MATKRRVFKIKVFDWFEVRPEIQKTERAYILNKIVVFKMVTHRSWIFFCMTIGSWVVGPLSYGSAQGDFSKANLRSTREFFLAPVAPCCKVP